MNPASTIYEPSAWASIHSPLVSDGDADVSIAELMDASGSSVLQGAVVGQWSPVDEWLMAMVALVAVDIAALILAASKRLGNTCDSAGCG